VDTVYPDGFTADEWLRIAQTSAQHAMALVNHRKALGIPMPSGATLREIGELVRAQSTRRKAAR
jgi:hypothetical protein